MYVSRDPRDAFVSYFHHHRMINSYEGSEDDFLEAFLADEVLFAPFWTHVLQYWRLDGRDHFLYLTFEEMKKVSMLAGKRLFCRVKLVVVGAGTGFVAPTAGLPGPKAQGAASAAAAPGRLRHPLGRALSLLPPPFL